MGEACQNRRFQKRSGAQTDVRRTAACGWGLFAAQAIQKDAFVIEALGELVDEDEAQDRLAAGRAQGASDSYMLAASDATTRGPRPARPSFDRARPRTIWRRGRGDVAR